MIFLSGHNKTLFHYLCCLKHLHGKQFVGVRHWFSIGQLSLPLQLFLTGAQEVPTIKWSIFRKIHGNIKSDFCNLCLTEKFFTLTNLRDNKLLNKKSEFVNKCCHQSKLLLSSVLCKDSMD